VKGGRKENGRKGGRKKERNEGRTDTFAAVLSLHLLGVTEQSKNNVSTF
jgi:hypothetical protein